jgi:glycosyltransferase involved in cell wall biosynthesis
VAKRKILVSAYGCEPFRGSEAGVGWNWVLQMAKYNELYIITRLNDKEKIQNNIPDEHSHNLHFIYYDTCELLKKVKRREKGLYLYYWMWQIGIIPIVNKLIKEHKFNYTMHLTFGSIWMPTFLPFFNVPFIWGPMGGGDCVPKALIHTLPLKQIIIQSFRYAMIKTGCINPLVSIPSKKAVAILCRTENNVSVIPKKYQTKTYIIIETAMSDDVFSMEKDYDYTNKTTEIITSGRLIPIKNVLSAIEAVNNLKKKNIEFRFTVVGTGPDVGRINDAIIKYGLQNKISLVGELPRTETLNRIRKADIYIFPSLKEGGSWALMEAMAIGLPIICLNCTGMNIITDELCAIRVEPKSYDYIVDNFSKALEKLIFHKEIREKMGELARERIKDFFTWDKKGNQIEEILNKIDLQNSNGNIGEY